MNCQTSGGISFHSWVICHSSADAGTIAPPDRRGSLLRSGVRRGFAVCRQLSPVGVRARTIRSPSSHHKERTRSPGIELPACFVVCETWCKEAPCEPLSTIADQRLAAMIRHRHHAFHYQKNVTSALWFRHPRPDQASIRRGRKPTPINQSCAATRIRRSAQNIVTARQHQSTPSFS